ncbi:MAG: type I-E CRISPR-associated protein Cas6/Cse3/CasE [Armatimonadetes bacterium]|nr:type I-E CRISPR-associated protein Cas6/Cse3/CasE [Armatimonadota bacterium]
MYISHLLIDIGNNSDRPRPGRLWLRNPYRVHQRLCMAFPSVSRKSEDRHFLKPFNPEDFGMSNQSQVNVARGTETGFLFCIDPRLGGRAMIVVQSAIEPDWGYAFCNAGYLLAAPPQVKPFDLAFSPEQILQFRLKANPTVRRKLGEDGKPFLNNRGEPLGLRIGLYAEAQQKEWLQRKARAGGFEIIDYCSITTENSDSRKGGVGENIKHLSVIFEGIIKVTAPDLFRATIESGIGSAKGFGFGLLSIAPLRR